MLVHKPAVHPMAASALAELHGAGVLITPEIVVWLQDAATRIAAKPTRSPADLIDWPVSCGGVQFYPLSYGAANWLMRMPDGMRTNTRTIAFACANSFKPEVFRELAYPMRARLAVIAWSISLRCSTRALSVVVDNLLTRDRMVEIGEAGVSDDSSAYHWGTLISALCAKYSGTTPDYWAWGVSRDKAWAMLCACAKDSPADEAGVTEYEVQANREFFAIVAEIKAGHHGG